VKRLPSDWFRRDVVTVAQDLVGTILVHGTKAGVIVETEAYLGPEDQASHTRFGLTARNSVMFGPGGVSYVYLCYGIHEMFNIVTGEDGQGQAVLIRAIAPYSGLPDDPQVGRGPGKVTKALGIDRSHDRKSLAKGPLYVAEPAAAPELAAWADVPARAIATGPRVGVDFAGDWAAKPYRFWWNAHPSVSRASSGGGTVKRSTRRKR
jgi:DNA-3-methyladenine glycosylase